MTTQLLQGIGLSCIRDDRVLFSELNFRLQSKQILLLEGKNGSGKTRYCVFYAAFVNPMQASKLGQ